MWWMREEEEEEERENSRERGPFWRVPTHCSKTERKEQLWRFPGNSERDRLPIGKERQPGRVRLPICLLLMRWKWHLSTIIPQLSRDGKFAVGRTIVHFNSSGAAILESIRSDVCGVICIQERRSFPDERAL